MSSDEGKEIKGRGKEEGKEGGVERRREREKGEKGEVPKSRSLLVVE